jgi:hypothetical protein
MTDYKLISADSHVSEPPDLWVDGVDRRYRDRAPRLVVNPPGLEGAYFLYEGYAPHPIGIGLAAGKSPEELAEFLTKGTYADARPGGWDPAERLKDNAQDGVEADVLYTTLGFRIFWLKDAGLQQECFRVYNDWLTAYCRYAPERMAGLAMISLYEPKAGAAELERCVKLGLKGAMIWCSPPTDRPYSSEIYDPFWARAQELRTPISLHSITGMAGRVSGASAIATCGPRSCRTRSSAPLACSSFPAYSTASRISGSSRPRTTAAGCRTTCSAWTAPSSAAATRTASS